VLFADLRGFTPFSEQAPPERVVAMPNEYFGRAVPVLLAHGGSVTQFVGDALMALFNAPTRQPDHALRAARAALGMQRAVEQAAVQEPGWPLFRVGVNTGPATYRAIAARAVAHPLEEIEIRGKRQRVTAWVLDGLHPGDEPLQRGA
jgi:class 3 adenylate cyclase